MLEVVTLDMLLMLELVTADMLLGRGLPVIVSDQAVTWMLP